MKKILLILLCLPFIAFAQKTYVPDDTFEQCLIDLGYDTLLDDSVLTSNISSVTNLVIYSNWQTQIGIADLTGIEDFDSLLNFQFYDYNNTLDSIDLGGNTALTSLTIHYLDSTSLNLSNNINLINLYLNNSNLPFLDLSGNINLTTLSLYYDSIAGGIDLTQNFALTNLYMSWSNLTTIDLSQNIALQSLNLYNMAFTELDLSHNVALIDFSYTDSIAGSLQSLNLQNGNNDSMYQPYIYAQSLFCIQVDDKLWADTNWSNIINWQAPLAIFSENCYSAQARGYIYMDTDSSTTFDSINSLNMVEHGVSNQILELVDGNGFTQYINTLNNGMFGVSLDSAQSYDLYYYPPFGFYETSNNSSYSFQNIPADSILTWLNFGLLPVSGYVDAVISITKSFSLCNDTARIYIDVHSVSGSDIDGDVDVWIDNNSPIINTSGSPVITNNHVQWNFTGLQPFNSIQYTIDVLLPPNPGVVLNDSARVTPLLQGNSYESLVDNNIDHLSHIVFCSYDPNDKQVDPEQCYYDSEDIMDYTIRFQNTGNYPAQKVRIIDTLDYNVLDILSLDVIGASHNYTWQFLGTSVLEIVFDNIWLVDSSVSHLESQGFFKYQIQFKDNISALSQSEMPAYIYFDYNQPIVTNAPLAVYSENFDVIINQSSDTLSVQVIDGASPFTYLWNLGDTTQNIVVPSTGLYWVIPIDANGCEIDTLFYNISILDVKEINHSRNLVRVVDILGRDIDINRVPRNVSFFFIYSDGTVEKRIILE